MNLKEQTATLQVGNQSWLARVIIQSPRSSEAVFSGGFFHSVKGNSQKARDLCTFELIQGEGIEFLSADQLKRERFDRRYKYLLIWMKLVQTSN